MPRTYNWRISMGLAAAPSLLMGIGLAMLPESPRWLLEQGRDAEALAALSGARGETEEESKGEVSQCTVLYQQLVPFSAV